MPNIELVDGHIEIYAQYSEKELVKLIPGVRWDPKKKLWITPLSWTVCLQLRGIFGITLNVGPNLTQWSHNEFNLRVKPAIDFRSIVDENATINLSQLPLRNVKLYGFQACGVRFLHAAGSALLNDDMGVGKTMQVVAALDPDRLPALIICPNSVKRSWERHIKEFHTCGVPYVVHGGAATRRKIIEAAKQDLNAIVIINIEAVRLLSRLSPYGSIRLARCRICDPKHGDEMLTPARCEVHPKELNNFGFVTVVVDECHRIKDPHSKQTRAVWAVGDSQSVITRWALTGTAISNHIGDLWSIMRFVAPDEYPNRSKFIDRYALNAWNAFGGLDIIGINPETRDEFFKILDPRYRRTPKALVLSQLPPKIRSTRWVSMTTKQRKAYDDLNAKLSTIMDDGTPLTVFDHLVKNTRMLQLTSSYADVEWIENINVTSKDKCDCMRFGFSEHNVTCRNRWKTKVTLTEPSPKIDALEEILTELGHKPIVVAAQSSQLIGLAAKRLTKLNISYGLITGDINEYERQLAIERFQRNEIRVMLITIDAGGEGVDGLQHADTMVILQRSWRMIANVQLEARVSRIGSGKHSSIHIIDVVTSDSIEETTLFPRLIEKFKQLEEIQRDRLRLSTVGMTPERMFTLDERETTITNTNLGIE